MGRPLTPVQELAHAPAKRRVVVEVELPLLTQMRERITQRGEKDQSAYIRRLIEADLERSTA